MNENNKNEAIPGLSKSSIKMDILYFKDDILKDMRGIQRNLDSKYLKTEDNLNSLIYKFETKINNFEKKIFELSNKINTDNTIRENVELLLKFKEETSDTLFKRRVKINDIEKRMNEEINRINDILTDTVIYPSVIGSKAKYKTFHEFMDNIIEEIAQFKLYKDKTGLDLGPFKKKIDLAIESFKMQLNNINNVSKEYTTSSIEQCEERIKSQLKIYDDRLQDSRMENSHYKMGLEKKSEEIKKELNYLNKAQEELYKKFDRHINDSNIEANFKYYNNEIISLNNRINKLNALLKELLSFSNNKIINNKEKKPKVYSGVKQYINGLLNADQLSTMKHFIKVDDSSLGKDIKRTDTEFSKRNSVITNDFFKMNHFSNINNIKDYNDSNKHYLSTKSANYNHINIYNKDINEENKNKKLIVRDLYQALSNENKNEEEKQKNISRRMSYNYTEFTSFRKLKFSDDSENKQNPKNKEMLVKTNSGTGLKSRNSHQFFNSSNNNIDLKNEAFLNLSEDSKTGNNTSKKSSKNNQNIIKEEDENNLSENSLSNNREENKNKKIQNNNINNNDNNIKSKEEKKENKKVDIKENNNKNNKNEEIKKKIDNNIIINNNTNVVNKNVNNKKDENNYIKKDNKENKDNRDNKDLNEKINKNNNIPSPKKDISNNSANNNYNYKIGINSLRKKNDNVPLLDILTFSPNENKKIRSQSSKRRNINNNNFFNKNINQEKNSFKNDSNIIINSYINNNYKKNKEYKNFPYLNELKMDPFPNTINKAKLIKNSYNNISNNTSLTFHVNKKKNTNKTKKLRLRSPDTLFSNEVIAKKSKKIMKNKSFGMGFERNNEAKELENLFNKLQSYIPEYD